MEVIDKDSNLTEATEYNSNPFTLSFKGFSLLAEYAKNILIIMIILGSIGMIMNFINYIPEFSSNSNFESSSQNNNVTSVNDSVDASTIIMVFLGVFALIIVLFFIALFVSAAYKGFVAAGTVSAMNKQTISVSEAFNQMRERFSALFKAEVITTLKIIGGLLLFIIPGIRAQLRYQSTPFILMSKKELSASEAIETSKSLYKNHLMEAFGIATVGAIIPFIGQAVMASGMTLSVNQLTEYSAINKETPKTHWLNYIGLFLVFFVLLFLLSIALLAIVVFTNTNS